MNINDKKRKASTDDSKLSRSSYALLRNTELLSKSFHQPKFDGQNFQIWKQRIIIHLNNFNLQHFLLQKPEDSEEELAESEDEEEDDSEPKDDKEETKVIKRDPSGDSKTIYNFLVQQISDKVFTLVISNSIQSGNASQLWEALSEKYESITTSNKVALRSKFYQLKMQPNEPMDQFNLLLE